MYYIEHDIEFTHGINKTVYGFHYVSRYQIDYSNNNVEIQISSNINKEEWVKSGYMCPFVNFYSLPAVPDFNLDPINYILLKLVSIEGTVFYKTEVKADYNLIRLTGTKNV